MKSSLEELRQAAKDCRACDLWKRGTQTVFGEGEPNAKIMFVGEQPGDREDLEGKPFVGPAGGLLDKGLAGGGNRSGESLRDERGKALQVGAARKTAHPQETECSGDRRLPALASGPKSSCAWAQQRHRRCWAGISV